jgi:uracil-DNA glycosylase
MRLCDLCSAPCFPAASNFELPPPGASRDRFKFATEDDRDFYAVLLNNHPPQLRGTLNPKVAVVGLSPAGNQIDEFVLAYSRSGEYGEASVAGAFAGLADSIIAMMDGLGLTAKLGLSCPDSTLARHPNVYVTSLVACATLDTAGGSDAFDPLRYPSAVRCISERFVKEMLAPSFSELRAILILGAKGWRAVNDLELPSGKTVVETLRSAGKLVMHLPHPSGQNREYVALSSLSPKEFPSCEAYIASCWERYKDRPPRTGRAKEPESIYKRKRKAAWMQVEALRQQVALP